MPEYAFAGLDINASIQRLCKIWGTETVLRHLRDWVAYMEGQIAIMEKHGMRHNDGSVVCDCPCHDVVQPGLVPCPRCP